MEITERNEYKILLNDSMQNDGWAYIEIVADV